MFQKAEKQSEIIETNTSSTNDTVMKEDRIIRDEIQTKYLTEMKFEIHKQRIISRLQSHSWWQI
jgi:hypothetical protein